MRTLYSPIIAIALTAALAFAVQPAAADPPDWRRPTVNATSRTMTTTVTKKRGKRHGRRRGDDDDYDQARRGGSQRGYWDGYDSRYNSRYGGDNYGVSGGTCNHARLSGYLGGGNAGQALGNAIGNAMGQQGNPLVGAIAGAVINQMLGNTVGQAMDPGDRSCFSQALEYGYDQRPVTWFNQASNSQYRVVPLRSYRSPAGNWCREFSYQLTQGGALLSNVTQTACRMADGSWQ